MHSQLLAPLASTSHALHYTSIARSEFTPTAPRTTCQSRAVFNSHGDPRHSTVSAYFTVLAGDTDRYDRIYNDASTYPDLTILLKKREGYKIDAHRVVLCLRNKVFANLVGKSGTQAVNRQPHNTVSRMRLTVPQWQTSRQLSLWGDVRSSSSSSARFTVSSFRRPTRSPGKPGTSLPESLRILKSQNFSFRPRRTSRPQP